MSNESSSSGLSSLLRWRPALFGLTAFAAGLTIYYASLSDHGQDAENGSAPGLRRSNAIRRRSPRLRHARASIATGADASSSANPQGQQDLEQQQQQQQQQQPPQQGEDGSNTAGQQDTDADDDEDYDPATSVAGDAEGGQNLLNLLYHIAEEQAHREGYVHRGVTCNSCNMLPIKGIRYRCANCPDYDLCEQCENLGVHDKTHLFYKIRIPAPFLGSNPRNQQPVWYPGKPYGLPRSIPKELKSKLLDLTGFDRSRIDALWEQFKSLAAVDWPEDPNGLRVAIDKKIWAKYCMPTMLREHEAPSALIFDQSFTFYDDNEDGLVGFEEFLGGLAAKQGKDQQEKLRRIFRAHDLDRDGYVCREDFTRLFTSNYTFMRELSRDLSHIMYEEILDDRPLRENLRGAQPVSSCFTGAIPSGDESRIGEGKTVSSTGDWVVTDGGGFIREPDNGLLHDREESGVGARPGVMSSLFADFGQPIESWPPHYVLPEDATVALGKEVPLEDVTAIADQQRVLDVANQRIDLMDRETGPPSSPSPTRANGVNESSSSDSSSPDTANGSGRLGQETPETESERSHQAIALLPQHQQKKTPSVEASFAQEYLYQATREGFDEVLDPMFRQMEDLYDFYERAASERARLQDEIILYRASPDTGTILTMWMTRTMRLWRKGEIESSAWVGTRLAEEIIRMLMKEQEAGSYEWVASIIDRIYSNNMTEEQLDSELEKLAVGQLDPSQGLSRKLRHAWWTVKHGEAPNPEQLDEFLDNVDERMQERMSGGDGDDGGDREQQPSTAAVGVINVDEQLIQELLDGENEEPDPPYNTHGHYEPLDEEEFGNLPEDRQIELARQYVSRTTQLTEGSGYNSSQQSSQPGDATGTGDGPALHGNRDQNGDTSHVQIGREQATEAGGEVNSAGIPYGLQATEVATALADLGNAFDDFNFDLFLDEMEVEEHVDPTLPQNRPDVAFEDTAADVGPRFLLLQQAAQQRATEQTSREMSQQYLRWTAVNQQGSISSMEQQDPLEDRTGSYFQVKLKYLSMLEMFAEQQDLKGGPSHLDRSEFEEIMLGQKGRRLETIGKWLDLAAF